MDKLFTFFSNLFSGVAASLQSVQSEQVFWFLLAVLALGGVLCAMLGKKSVINRGIGGALQLIVLYLSAMVLYSLFPRLQYYSELPFLSVQSSWMALLSPLQLTLSQLLPVLVRFLLLVFAVNLADSLIVSGDNLVIWLCTQFLSLVAGMVLYIVIITGINYLAPALLGKWAVLLLGGVVLLIVAYLVFVVFTDEGEAASQSLTRRLTSNRGGALVVISGLSLSLTMGLLCVLPRLGFATWEFHEVRSLGFLWVAAMFLGVLCVYSMLFHDRRKL